MGLIKGEQSDKKSTERNDRIVAVEAAKGPPGRVSGGGRGQKALIGPDSAVAAARAPHPLGV